MSKRMHVHLTVSDLAASTAFYHRLFDQEPDLVREDMVKWQLDDPSVNFAISVGTNPGVSHLGIESATAATHQALTERLDPATGVTETAAQCCYAVSDKLWLNDPNALSWELFHTHERESDQSAEEPTEAPAGEPRMMPSIQGGVGGCC